MADAGNATFKLKSDISDFQRKIQGAADTLGKVKTSAKDVSTSLTNLTTTLNDFNPGKLNEVAIAIKTMGTVAESSKGSVIDFADAIKKINAATKEIKNQPIEELNKTISAGVKDIETLSESIGNISKELESVNVSGFSEIAVAAQDNTAALNELNEMITRNMSSSSILATELHELEIAIMDVGEATTADLGKLMDLNAELTYLEGNTTSLIAEFEALAASSTGIEDISAEIAASTKEVEALAASFAETGEAAETVAASVETMATTSTEAFKEFGGLVLRSTSELFNLRDAIIEIETPIKMVATEFNALEANKIIAATEAVKQLSLDTLSTVESVGQLTLGFTAANESVTTSISGMISSLVKLDSTIVETEGELTLFDTSNYFAEPIARVEALNAVLAETIRELYAVEEAQTEAFPIRIPFSQMPMRDEAIKQGTSYEMDGMSGGGYAGNRLPSEVQNRSHGSAIYDEGTASTEKLGHGLHGLTEEAGHAEKALEETGKGIEYMIGPWALGYGAIIAVGMAFSSLSEAAKNGLQTFKTVEDSAYALAGAFNGSNTEIKEMTDNAITLSQTPFATSDQLASLEAELKFRGLTTQQVKDVIPAMINLKTVYGDSFASMEKQTNALSLALIGQTRGIKRYIGEVEKGATPQEILNKYIAAGASQAQAAASKQASLGGQIEQATKDIRDQSLALGEAIQPASLYFDNIYAGAIHASVGIAAMISNMTTFMGMHPVISGIAGTVTIGGLAAAAVAAIKSVGVGATAAGAAIGAITIGSGVAVGNLVSGALDLNKEKKQREELTKQSATDLNYAQYYGDQYTSTNALANNQFMPAAKRAKYATDAATFKKQQMAYLAASGAAQEQIRLLTLGMDESPTDKLLRETASATVRSGNVSVDKKQKGADPLIIKQLNDELATLKDKALADSPIEMRLANLKGMYTKQVTATDKQMDKVHSTPEYRKQMHSALATAYASQVKIETDKEATKAAAKATKEADIKAEVAAGMSKLLDDAADRSDKLQPKLARNNDHKITEILDWKKRINEKKITQDYYNKSVEPLLNKKYEQNASDITDTYNEQQTAKQQREQDKAVAHQKELQTKGEKDLEENIKRIRDKAATQGIKLSDNAAAKQYEASIPAQSSYSSADGNTTRDAIHQGSTDLQEAANTKALAIVIESQNKSREIRNTNYALDEADLKDHLNTQLAAITDSNMTDAEALAANLQIHTEYGEQLDLLHSKQAKDYIEKEKAVVDAVASVVIDFNAYSNAKQLQSNATQLGSALNPNKMQHVQSQIADTRGTSIASAATSLLPVIGSIAGPVGTAAGLALSVAINPLIQLQQQANEQLTNIANQKIAAANTEIDKANSLYMQNNPDIKRLIDAANSSDKVGISSGGMIISFEATVSLANAAILQTEAANALLAYSQQAEQTLRATELSTTSNLIKTQMDKGTITSAQGNFQIGIDTNTNNIKNSVLAAADASSASVLATVIKQNPSLVKNPLDATAQLRGMANNIYSEIQGGKSEADIRKEYSQFKDNPAFQDMITQLEKLSENSDSTVGLLTAELQKGSEINPNYTIDVTQKDPFAFTDSNAFFGPGTNGTRSINMGGHVA